jgi:hypothetical protein
MRVPLAALSVSHGRELLARRWISKQNTSVDSINTVMKEETIKKERANTEKRPCAPSPRNEANQKYNGKI